MKKLYTLLFVALTGVAFGQVLTETFNFTGALNTNGWTNFTTGGGTAGQLMTSTTTSDNGNSLAYNGLLSPTGNRTSVVAGNTEDLAKNFASPLTGTIYYSLLIKAQNSAALEANTNTIGDYFFALSSTIAPSSPVYFSRLYAREGSTAGSTINIGVLNTSGGTVSPTFSGDLPINTTVFVVMKYEISTNTASLFINPTPGSTEPTTTLINNTGTGNAPTSIQSVVIRQGSAATPKTGNFEIDEIRVGTTWADVTPPATASIADNNIEGLTMYPNPLKGNTLFITSTANADMNVKIYNVLGKEVLSTKVNNTSVDVSNLASGVYMVKITEEGKTATRKLVIQ